MRFFELRTLLRATGIAAALTLAGFWIPQVLDAQEPGQPGAAQPEPEYVQEAEPADDGGDWGWLGLLGLAGLLGLRRRDRQVHRVDPTTSRL